MRVMLLHGWGGSDFPHWQSYIAGEIAKDYGCVNFVRLPEFDTPTLQSWLECAQKELDRFEPDIVLCHSLANTLWFHLALRKSIKNRVKKLYLVAPPSLECTIEELSSFFPVSVPSELYAQEVMLVVSDNDPYMELEEAKKLQKSLNTDLHVIPNGGHINAESGFGAWEWMVEQIKHDMEKQWI